MTGSLLARDRRIGSKADPTNLSSEIGERIREDAIGALQILDGPQLVAANMRLTDQGLAIGADAIAFDHHIGQFASAILLEDVLALVALGLGKPLRSPQSSLNECF